jgi:hypothetical protein
VIARPTRIGFRGAWIEMVMIGPPPGDDLSPPKEVVRFSSCCFAVSCQTCHLSRAAGEVAVSAAGGGFLSTTNRTTSKRAGAHKRISKRVDERHGSDGVSKSGSGGWNRPITTAQLKRLAELPPDIAAVAGFARSGLLPATYLATALHVPLYELSEVQGLRPIASGNRASALVDQAAAITSARC